MIAATIGLGLLIGLSLGALGGGGSILTVPALVYVLGEDPRQATTSSLFIVGVTALIGSLGHARSGRVRWGIGLAFGVTGVAASFLGTAANRLVDPDVLLLAFAGLILIAAIAMLTKSGPNSSPPSATAPAAGPGRPAGAPTSTATLLAPTTSPSATGQVSIGSRVLRMAKIAAAGLLVGFLTGFFGVGGGFVIVPALTLALGLSMPSAIATSLLVIAINSGGSLLARAGTADFDWAVIAPFTCAAIAGSFAGKKVADRLSANTLTRAFAALCIAVAIYVATSSLMALLG
ncbi:sulfite exporter TauE/SafE family protein [Modestobacter muralis]|uniref:Probable membrane transporter protein n=1 Tax=Modestobacter muralis TaxID=1608614 RepID=A0A6P0EZ96_9ACTN|nr:sulfite exporter TauE/SafE family protein [Modestobacter muralis]NEN52042.1 sulfite exporter TauE/SafE family protein [Modestobacter muralis]